MEEQQSQLAAQADKLAAAGDAAGLQALWGRIISDDVPQIVARQATAHFAKALVASPLARAEDGDAFLQIAEHCLAALAARATPPPAEEAERTLREALFDHYVAAELFKDAANALAGLNLEGAAGRALSDEEKAEVHVKVAEAFLADDEPDAAENYVNKASPLMAEVQNWQLQLRYRTVSARVLDANRKFLDAAMRYYELSQARQAAQIAAEDLLELLGRGITCAVLGKAGPQRTRILANFYKDPRLASLENVPPFQAHPQVLTKMYKCQVLRKNEMKAFEEGLAEHQKAKMGDGLTIPERAVIEHNMVAAAHIYENVRFGELGALLEIPPAKAEQVAARMISEKRLEGSIDQVDGVLQLGSGGGELQDWDERLGAACARIATCVEAIGAEHPQLVEA
eukprot:TRINITY_DN2305_c0_g5_i1.p1 TRINITY_DN2305_c0_g5~~TRINITY_DN2305_c0_g5_i1.p1  ORF type:complete len:398 (+),score=177.15 TRINITY_DN2305_c0_g5_i1:256-1449(+)